MKANFNENRLLVNIVGIDSFQSYSCKTFEQKNSHIHMEFSESPLLNEGFDVFVLPLPFVTSLFSSDRDSPLWVQVIGHGEPEYLSLAFLYGCADYLKEPWTPEELYLRARRIARKQTLHMPWGSITYSSKNISSAYHTQPLTHQEYTILRILIMNRGSIVSRTALYYALWGYSSKKSRVVDMHIVSLRKKLQAVSPKDSKETIISSVHGKGYIIHENASL